MMHRALLVALFCLLGPAATVGAAAAQPNLPPAPPAGPSRHRQDQSARPSTPAKVNPDVIRALERMGTFLRSQTDFSVESRTQTDEVLDSGQKIQLSAVTHISVQRPDHLYARTTSDRKDREFFYDGRTFTINSPRTGYYATVRAPATIGQLLDRVRDHFGIQLPLADLFYWGTPRARTDLITSAIDVGPSTVNGVPAEQYALRQPGLDWQIWIQKGDQPLPLKLVLTTTTEPSQPQYVAVLRWKLDAHVDPRAFTFTPTPASKPIQLLANPESAGGAP